jgi:glycerol-3-phosphate acyltransferase PlsY
MIWAALVGYSIGSIPSADLIARWRGHDLRTSGSGNPGTANALRVAGRGVAITILLIDLGKGITATLAGWAIDGPGTAVAAGVAAVAGQVLNPWFRFRGGKGLGVTGGVTAVAWPPGALLVLPVAAAAASVLRAAGGALAGLTAYTTGAVLWAANDWPTWWGIPADDRLVWLAIGVSALTAPKFAVDVSRRRG